MYPTFDARDQLGHVLRRMAVWAVGVAAVVFWAGTAWLLGGGSRGSVTAAAPSAVGESRSLWIADSPIDDGRRLLLVVDPERKHAAVYHVDAASGSLTLKSTRDIGWDLLIEDFNAQPPKPADLKRMLEAGGGPPPSR